MGTVVLLAAFLLAASANPIDNSHDNSIESAPDTHSEDTSPTDDHSQFSDPHDTPNESEEHDPSVDKFPDSADGTGDADTGDADTGDTDTSSVSTVNDSDVGDAAIDTEEHSTSVEKSPDTTGDTEDANTGDVVTSSVSTVSAISTKADTSTQQSSDGVPTPGDADPFDCRNATQRKHIYDLCTFSCQQDEMFTAPDNSSCYIYPKNLTTEILLTKGFNHTEHNANETGVCLGGECVPRSAGATAATTESSATPNSTAETGDTSTPQSNETVPTPGDADPFDCRNATQRNHVYDLCTFSCQEDEMFTAPDNSSCYLYPKNLTTGILLTKEYTHTEHNVNETGVCFGGECVPRSIGARPATTEYSPATTTTTAETVRETESTINEQAPDMTAKPNEVSQPSPQPSLPQDTPAENGGGPQSSLPNVGSSEKEGDSQVKNSPEAIPGSSPPEQTPTENAGRQENPSSNAEVEETSAVPNGPVALPGALAAMT